jgi:hypothetical protein
MVEEFITKLVKEMFASCNAIGTYIGAVLFVLSFFIPKLPKWLDKMKNKTGKISWPFRLIILLVCLLISMSFASYSLYQEQQNKINGYTQDVPKFKLRRGNVWCGKNLDANTCILLVEAELTNYGSPSITNGWEAELRLNSQIIGHAPATMMFEGKNSQIWGNGKLIAEFHKDNNLIDKTAEEPLAKGGRRAGWLRFDFSGVTEDQMKNAGKIIYVQDVLCHKYSLDVTNATFDANTYIPRSGTPPFIKP